MLVQYVRNRKNKRVGVVVGFKNGSIGWSLCKTKPTKDNPGVDEFSREHGITIAVGRAKKYGDFAKRLITNPDYEKIKNNCEQIPRSCLPVIEKMVNRIEKYNKK